MKFEDVAWYVGCFFVAVIFVAVYGATGWSLGQWLGLEPPGWLLGVLGL